jgi:uncharacterized small protein (DUF1192 family)
MTDDVKTHKPEEEPAPLVDEALEAIDRKTCEQDDVDALREEVEALQAEITRLKATAHASASGSGSFAIHDASRYIQSQPLAFAAAVGLFTFIFGVTR